MNGDRKTVCQELSDWLTILPYWALGMLLLWLMLGCASAPPPLLPRVCMLDHKETVATTRGGLPGPDRHVLYLDCGDRVVQLDISSIAMYGAVQRGDCLELSGEYGRARGRGKLRPLAACPSPAIPPAAGNSAALRLALASEASKR